MLVFGIVFALLRAAPADCDPRALDTRVRAELGAEARENLEFRIEITRSDTRVTGVLVIARAGRVYRRELEGESCDALMDAAALVVASAAEGLTPEGKEIVPPSPPPRPSAAQDQSEPRRLLTSPEPTPSATSTERTDGATPPARRTAVRLGAAAGGGIASVAPGTGLVRAHVSVHRGHFVLAAEGAYWTRRRTDVLGPPLRREVELGTAGIAACGSFGDRFEGGPCGTLEVGGMRARLRGSRSFAPAIVPWVAVRAGARGSLRVARRVRLFAMADVGLAPVRPDFRFTLTDGSRRVVYRPSLVSARFAGGIEVTVTR